MPMRYSRQEYSSDMVECGTPYDSDMPTSSVRSPRDCMCSLALNDKCTAHCQIIVHQPKIDAQKTKTQDIVLYGV